MTLSWGAETNLKVRLFVLLTYIINTISATYLELFVGIDPTILTGSVA